MWLDLAQFKGWMTLTYFSRSQLKSPKIFRLQGVGLVFSDVLGRSLRAVPAQFFLVNTSAQLKNHYNLRMTQQSAVLISIVVRYVSHTDFLYLNNINLKGCVSNFHKHFNLSALFSRNHVAECISLWPLCHGRGSQLIDHYGDDWSCSPTPSSN